MSQLYEEKIAQMRAEELLLLLDECDWYAIRKYGTPFRGWAQIESGEIPEADEISMFDEEIFAKVSAAFSPDELGSPVKTGMSPMSVISAVGDKIDDGLLDMLKDNLVIHYEFGVMSGEKTVDELSELCNQL